MRRLLPILLILPALLATADVRSENMVLTVKPVLCITDKRNQSCDMSFIVSWLSGSTGYYCLLNNFGEEPLRCWNEARAGDLTDEQTVEKDFSYWMIGTDTTARLAQVDIEVLRMDSDDRRRKRRTRHVWDIN